jgi:hypothetical protein
MELEPVDAEMFPPEIEIPPWITLLAILAFRRSISSDWNVEIPPSMVLPTRSKPIDWSTSAVVIDPWIVLS